MEERGRDARHNYAALLWCCCGDRVNAYGVQNDSVQLRTDPVDSRGKRDTSQKHYRRTVSRISCLRSLSLCGKRRQWKTDSSTFIGG